MLKDSLVFQALEAACRDAFGICILGNIIDDPRPSRLEDIMIVDTREERRHYFAQAKLQKGRIRRASNKAIPKMRLLRMIGIVGHVIASEEKGLNCAGRNATNRSVQMNRGVKVNATIVM